MGIIESLSILVGMIGIAFIFYAFSVIKVFGRNVRWMGITMLVLLGIMLSDRLFAGDVWDLPWTSPFREQFGPQLVPVQTGWQNVPEALLPFMNKLAKTKPPVRPAPLQPGWQEIPSTVFTLLLPMLGEWKIPSEFASPIPAAPLPSQPPQFTTPAPAPPNLSPSVQPSPSLSPTPHQIPGQIPGQPHPTPSPRPDLAVPPSSPSPIPAWW